MLAMSSSFMCLNTSLVVVVGINTFHEYPLDLICDGN